MLQQCPVFHAHYTHRLTILLAQQESTKLIPLSGQGRVPEVPLCAMCKVDGCFVLIPINEVTQMRPDMSNFVQSAYVKDANIGGEEDLDYKPPESKPASAAKASTSKPSTSKGKATPKTVKVRCQVKTMQQCVLKPTSVKSPCLCAQLFPQACTS